MIVSMKRLDFNCKECGKPAVFDVKKTNEDLPDNYIKDGVRMESYCDDHLPSEERKFWNYMEIDQIPHFEPYS